jgi:hypothetical protein
MISGKSRERSLRAYVVDYLKEEVLDEGLTRNVAAILVCTEPAPRVVDGVEVLPWREFLARLWAGDVLS